MLEAEEASKPAELKLEEVEEAVEKAGRAIAAAEAVQPKTFRIAGHEVVEELREGEDVSCLRCVKCGLVVRLDEVSKLTDTPCAEGRRQDEVEQKREEAEKVEARACEYCGKPSMGAYPIEYVSGSQVYLSLCSDCAKKVEEMYAVARPNIADRSGKRLIRCRHPMEGVRRLAWYHYAATWFMADEDGRWPCPACGAVYDRLLDAAKHFVEKHPDLASRSGREHVTGVGDVWRTWQGYYCPVCGLLCDSVKTLREHYESHKAQGR
jgi:rubrerythrin